ncbi:MAG: glycosyltransferase [Cyanobacteriota bacterium]|nr:glycosyltransferase [Cyanobacteriota bacterium]
MTDYRRFQSGIREDARHAIENFRDADIVVGIPAYCSDSTLVHVIKVTAAGLRQFYGNRRSLIMVADGGSTDDTRESARSVHEQSFDLGILVTIYRGVPGKGSAVRAIFEAARYLHAPAVALFDSDLRSIKPSWIRNLIDPICSGYDFVAPFYSRYKFDGTITNTIAYYLVRSLYGVNIRQPIGGDFGLSSAMISHCLNQDVWDTDIAKFGIDVWLSITAIVSGFKICQARLGTKIHGEKDPSEDLGPMFREVVGTIFTLIPQHRPFIESVTHTRATPIFGDLLPSSPQPFVVSSEPLLAYFRLGFNNFGSVWKNILEPRDFETVEKLAQLSDQQPFEVPPDVWVRIIYRYAATFAQAQRQRIKILDTLVPLYHAKVAALVQALEGHGEAEAEAYYESQARNFESQRGYLLSLLHDSQSSSAA